jgi:hypothetical protein
MTVAAGIPPPTREDGLGSLIQEFQSSQQPLLRLYGDDLNQSYSELLRKRGVFCCGARNPFIRRFASPSRCVSRKEGRNIF